MKSNFSRYILSLIVCVFFLNVSFGTSSPSNNVSYRFCAAYAKGVADAAKDVNMELGQSLSHDEYLEYWAKAYLICNMDLVLDGLGLK